MPDQATVTRIRAEFLEMPGMRLTFDQTRRLCGVERAPCQIALDALVDEKFLFVGSDGVYGRLTDRQTHDRRSSKQLSDPRSDA